MLNYIGIQNVLTPYEYFESYWFIDGKSLPQYLEEWAKESQDDYFKSIRKFVGLCPAWNKNLMERGDVRFVWKVIGKNSAVLPLLLCEDDRDFSCIVFVVEVEKTNDFVYWNRIGYVLHDKEDFDEEKKSGILNTEVYSPEDWEKYGDNIALESIDSPKWLQWIGENWEEELYRRRMNYTLPFYETEGNVRWIKDVNWKFDRVEYENMVIAFWEDQTLKQLKNIARTDVINITDCANLLADLTVYGRLSLDNHIQKYGEIQLHILAGQLVTEPLISLLKHHPERKRAIDIYYKIIEVMSQNGTEEVKNVVDVTILERLAGEKDIWKSVGPFLTKLTTPKSVKRKRYLIFSSVVLLACILLCFVAKRNLPISRTDFDSIEHFKEMGGECWRFDLPDGAQDEKYYLTYTVIYRHSLYSFRIDDEEKYDAFMEYVKDEAIYEHSAGYPGWEWYMDGRENCSEEEYAEREYLKQNHVSMDYEEVLERASKHKYGFANAYGADVEDYIDLDYELDNFPIGLPFEEVIADDIRDYTLLIYNPSGSGSITEGIAVNEKTHQFVVFYSGAIR